MKYWMFAAAICLTLASCGSSHHHHDDSDDHHDDRDVARVEDVEDENVYRPSNNRNGSTREKPKEEPKAEEPKSEPDPVVEEPKEEPKPDKPVEEPKEEPKEPDPVVEEPEEPDQPKEEEPVVEEPVEEPKGNSPTKHEQLADEFVAAVKELTYDLEETKLWKDYIKAFEEYEKRLDKAVEKKNDDNGKGKDLEQAWASTIEAWYEARYMQVLFLHLNSPAKDFVPIFLHDRNEVLTLSDDELASADCRMNQAASELVASETQGLGKFQTDVLKYDLVASKVLDDKKWQKRFSDEKEKWQKAVDGEFDEKDLKKYRK